MADPDPLVGLHDLRLPPDAPFQAVADLAAALGVGLLLAWLLSPLLSRLTLRRARPVSLEDQIAALATLPDDRRIPALLHLLAKRAPEAARRFGDGIYCPGGLPPAAEVEAALRKAG